MLPTWDPVLAHHPRLKVTQGITTRSSSPLALRRLPLAHQHAHDSAGHRPDAHHVTVSGSPAPKSCAATVCPSTQTLEPESASPALEEAPPRDRPLAGWRRSPAWTPLTVVSQFWWSITTWVTVRFDGRGVARAALVPLMMARRSACVSGRPDPGPPRAPPCVLGDDERADADDHPQRGEERSHAVAAERAEGERDDGRERPSGLLRSAAIFAAASRAAPACCR